MEIKVPQERMRKAPQERMRLASKTKRHGWVYHERRKETIMAKYRKLGRTSPQRKALLRNQVTALLYHGKIVTTEARAKEVRKIAEHLITLAIKERDNYETVTVTAKVPVKDKDGKRVKEVIDGKRVTKFENVEKEIRKDLPSRGTPKRWIWWRKCSMSMALSTQTATAAIQGSSRRASARAMPPWKSFWSLFNSSI